MSQEQVDQSQQEQQQEQQQEPSSIELRAAELGWRPKEEFNGDEDDFIDAKEFVRRQPLFDKIEHQSKKLKSVEKALDAMKEHYTKVKETEYNRAVADLKAARKAATQEGDFERAELIDEHLDRVETEAKEFAKVQESIKIEEPEQANPKFTSWVHRNPWYNDKAHMRVFADEYGIKLARAGANPDEVLKQVEEAVRKEFPTQFRNPNRDTANQVESPTRKSSTKGAEVELSEQERTIMNTLVRGGHVTKEQYLADLKKVKGQ